MMNYNLKEICKTKISNKTVEVGIESIIDALKRKRYVFSSDNISLSRKEIEAIIIAIIKKIPLKQIYITYNKDSNEFSIVRGEKIILAIVLYTMSLYKNSNIYANPNSLIDRILNENEEVEDFENLKLYIDCVDEDISFENISDKSRRAFLNRMMTCTYIETEDCLNSQYENIMNLIDTY